MYEYSLNLNDVDVEVSTQICQLVPLSILSHWMLTVWNGQTRGLKKRSTKGSHLNRCRCTTAPPSFPRRSLSCKRKSFRSHATALRAMADTEHWLKKGAELFRFFWGYYSTTAPTSRGRKFQREGTQNPPKKEFALPLPKQSFLCAPACSRSVWWCFDGGWGWCGVLLSTDSNTLTLDSDCWNARSNEKKNRPGRWIFLIWTVVRIWLVLLRLRRLAPIPEQVHYGKWEKWGVFPKIMVPPNHPF